MLYNEINWFYGEETTLKNKYFANIIMILCFIVSFGLLYSLNPSSILQYTIYFCIMLFLTITILVIGFLALKDAMSTDYSFIALMGILSGSSFLIYILQISILLIFIMNHTPQLALCYPGISPCISILLAFFSSGAVLLSAILYDSNVNKKIVCQYIISGEFLFATLAVKLYLKFFKPTLIVPLPFLCLLIVCISFFLGIFILYKKSYFKTSLYPKETKLVLFFSFLVSSSFLFNNALPNTLKFIILLVHIGYIVIMFKVLVHACLIKPNADKTAEVEAYRQTYMDLSKDMENYILATSNLKQQVANIDNIYKHLLQIYPDGFFILSEDIICDTNDTAADMAGTNSSHDLINHNFFDFVPEKYHHALRELFSQLQEGSPKICTLEFEIMRSNCTNIVVEGSFIIFNSYDSSLILISLRDVSYRKERLKLEQQIEMEKLKVEFFSSISHELKTPLNIIYSASHLQKKLYGLKEYNKLPYYNKMISHNCLRLLRLLNNLLDITRLDGNYFTSHDILANIVSIVENVSDCIAPHASEKNITTIFDTQEEDIVCLIDPELIERIVLNLLSNAIKYGKADGHIWIDMYPKNKRVWIHVKDDGLGIPIEKLPFIFDRFTRVDTGLIRRAEGAGLGLALVKSLIELEHGSIEVSSTVDVGSEFIISFPLANITEGETDYDFIPTLSEDKVIMELSDITL